MFKQPRVKRPNLFEVDNSSGTALAWIDSTGKFHGDGSNLANLPAGISGLTSGGVPYSTGSTTLATDEPNFFWDATNHRLGIGNATPAASFDLRNTLSSATGTDYAVKISPTINASGTEGYTALYVNAIESTVGSGAKLLTDLQVGGTSKFKVDDAGNVTLAGMISGNGSGLTGIAGSISGLVSGGLTYATGGTTITTDEPNLFWNPTNHFLGIGNATPAASFDLRNTLSSASGTDYAVKISPTINASGTEGYTALYVNAIESTVGSGSKLLTDLQVGGTSKFKVDDTGAVTFTGIATGNGSGLTNISSASVAWATPGTIGSTTANTGAFTTLTANGVTMLTGGYGILFEHDRNSRRHGWGRDQRKF